MFAPWQGDDAARADRREQRGQCVFAANRYGFAGNEQRVEPTLFEAFGDLAFVIPAEDALGDEPFGMVALEYVGVEGRGREDETVASIEAQVENHEPGFAMQGAGFMQSGTTPVRQLVARRLRIIAPGHAIGEGVDEKIAHGMCVGNATRGRARLKSPAPAGRHLVDRRESADIRRAGAGGARTAITPQVQGGHPLTEVVGTTLLTTQG